MDRSRVFSKYKRSRVFSNSTKTFIFTIDKLKIKFKQEGHLTTPPLYKKDSTSSNFGNPGVNLSRKCTQVQCNPIQFNFNKNKNY